MDSNRILISLGSGDSLEVGMVIAWTLATNPSDSYLECNGQAVDGSKYPKLYTLMHNTPDYRGVFLRGLGGNSASLGELQGDAIRNITGSTGIFTSQGWPTSSGALFTKASGDGDNGGRSNEGHIIYFDASRVVPTAEENRPINKAIRYFIKAK